MKMEDSNHLLPLAFLPGPGEPPVPWSNWLRAFETWLTAAGLEKAEDAQKRALLGHSLGTEGQRVFAMLGSAASFEEAVRKLSEHFQGRRNVMVQRFQFRQRAQLPGETFVVFASVLRRLAAACDFGPLQDQLILGQLIEKAADWRIREQLLLEPNSLTLARAVELGSQMEEAFKEVHTRVISAAVKQWESWSSGNKNWGIRDFSHSTLLHPRGGEKPLPFAKQSRQSKQTRSILYSCSMGPSTASTVMRSLGQKEGCHAPAKTAHLGVKNFQVGHCLVNEKSGNRSCKLRYAANGTI